MKGAVKRFRLIATLEGISFLVLLFIAMPLKYMADMPEPVRYTGWLHGILFILYIAMLVDVKTTKDWPWNKTLLAFVAALVPFGPFIFEKKMMKSKKEKKAAVKETQV